MISNKYGTDEDPYCYKNTDVLINKLDIKSNKILEKIEEEITILAADEIEFLAPPYNLEYWINIHKSLFEDLYSWAGEFRSLNITKGSTVFCNPLYIDNELIRIFNNLECNNYFMSLSYTELIPQLAELYIELNVIHPFREGNGRSQRILFDHIIINCGYKMDWSQISKNIWLEANISGVELNYKPMIEIVKKSLTEF
ncbi:MAG: Fic family protein [Spirochaetaceae bacterium]